MRWHSVWLVRAFNDVYSARVPISQAEMLVKALKENGTPV
jgi:hypothetical protein